jgi:hypothetical protein
LSTSIAVGHARHSVEIESHRSDGLDEVIQQKSNHPVAGRGFSAFDSDAKLNGDK